MKYTEKATKISSVKSYEKYTKERSSMKTKIKIETKQRCWSLVTDITYATVPSWYGATYRDMKCSVCMPKVREEGKKYPLIIWLCGGAFKVMDKDVWWPQWTDFARKGCVIASVEYRTSNEEVFPAALCDVKAAVRYFRANAQLYGIDAERIFVSGESAGGALAGLAGVTGGGPRGKYDVGAYLDYDSSVQGVIDFYGVVDMTTRAIQDTSNLTFGAEDAFIGVEGDREALKKEASAAWQVTPDAPPFLIFHGETDDLVPVSQSDTLYEHLCQAGVRADYYVLEQESHGADAFYQKEIMEIVWKFVTSAEGGEDE